MIEHIVPAHLPGDVILVKGTEFISNVIIEAQRRLVPRCDPHYSHVILNAGVGIFVHSTEEGVHIVGESYVFNEANYGPGWKALRNRELQDRIVRDGAFSVEVTKSAVYYLRQRYNGLFHLKSAGSPDETSFCSELVAKVYRDLGLPISSLPPTRTFPVHIQQLVGHSDWLEITHLYRREEWSEEAKKWLEDFVEENANRLEEKTGVSPEQGRIFMQDMFDNSDYGQAEVIANLMYRLQDSVVGTVNVYNSMKLWADFLERIGFGAAAQVARARQPIMIDIPYWNVPKPAGDSVPAAAPDVTPEQTQPLGTNIAEAEGIAFHPLGTLEEAQADPDGEVARRQTAIEEKDRQIGRLESELREAFYVIGTGNELKALVKEEVLQRQRSGLTQSLYRVGSDNYRYRLRRMDSTASRIVIGSRLRGAEIVSLHQSYKRLYRFEQEGDETVLVITDPLQFWDISKYLVLQVER